MTFCCACYTIKRCKGRSRRRANIRQRRRFGRRFVLLSTASDATRSVSRVCVFGQTKNTARTRQAVLSVGRGDARRKERHCRDGTAIAAKAVKRKQTESVGTFLHEFLPIASHATRGVSRVCVFGQTKNTARTRQAVQFVGRGDAIRTRNLRFWRPLLYR